MALILVCLLRDLQIQIEKILVELLKARKGKYYENMFCDNDI